MATKLFVNRIVEVGQPPAEAMQSFQAFFATWFAQGRWEFAPPVSTDSITFARKSFHTWQIVIAILLFPIGLIALLAEKDRSWITATFSPKGENDTAINLTGVIPDGSVGTQIVDRVDEFDPAQREESALTQVEPETAA